jgi:hypothetical protein
MLSLTQFLKDIDTAASEDGDGWVYVMHNEYSRGGFLIDLNDDPDDPPVWTDNEGAEDKAEWDRQTNKFSEFAWMFVLDGAVLSVARKGPGNLWLLSQDEPFQPPVIDFLTERFGEPERTPRPHNVTTYTFRPLGGTIRVTADEPTLTGGLSAWWIHADTPERLAEFAELLLPWGTLRDTLRTDTIPAGAVLKRVRGGE